MVTLLVVLAVLVAAVVLIYLRPRTSLGSARSDRALSQPPSAPVAAPPTKELAAAPPEVQLVQPPPPPIVPAETVAEVPAAAVESIAAPPAVDEAPAVSPQAPDLLQATAPARDIEGLRRGLTRSRGTDGFFGRLVSLLSGKKEIIPELASHIEEVLLSSDVGVQTTQLIIDQLREKLSRRELADPDAVWGALRDEARSILKAHGRRVDLNQKARPSVILLVGVNGSGKTTTIGKLATRLKSQGRSVILAAGDTFRAAAVQQLRVWGDRAGIEVVHGKDGADPGSVIFEAVRKAREHGADVVLADTAGRLHTKSNLMAELKKVVKTTGRAMDGAPHEILLVIDATNGQNAVAQAREFCQELPIDGIVLTKLDGTAKGGFVLGISAALQLPVKLIGLGEKATDLHDFDADDFVEALLGTAADSPGGA
jgi:fused signal recognition particle receptor